MAIGKFVIESRPNIENETFVNDFHATRSEKYIKTYLGFSNKIGFLNSVDGINEIKQIRFLPKKRSIYGFCSENFKLPTQYSNCLDLLTFPCSRLLEYLISLLNWMSL